jgi:hypothetical protein
LHFKIQSIDLEFPSQLHSAFELCSVISPLVEERAISGDIAFRVGSLPYRLLDFYISHRFLTWFDYIITVELAPYKR